MKTTTKKKNKVEVKEEDLKKLKLYEYIEGETLGYCAFTPVYTRVPGGLIRTCIGIEKGVSSIFIALPNSYFIA